MSALRLCSNKEASGLGDAQASEVVTLASDRSIPPQPNMDIGDGTASERKTTAPLSLAHALDFALTY